MTAPLRVIATPAALELLAQIVEQHGAVLIHQSGGCCDGSTPMCYPQDDFLLGESDVLLGHAGDTPVYIGGQQFEVWKHTQLILDADTGRGGMFSLDNGTGRRFLVRSKVLGADQMGQSRKVTN